MKIKISNYRNIPFESPIEFELNDGITFILGPNNVGKSNLLRFLYEFRPLFLQEFNPNLPEESFNIRLLNKYDQIISRSLKSHEEILIEIIGENNHGVIYIIKPANRSNSHSESVYVTARLSNVMHATKESRKLIKEIFELFSNTFLAGVFRTPEMIASGNSYDLEIGSSFIENWSTWADGGEIQKMNKIKSLKDELRQIFGYATFEIRTNKQRNNLIVINDDGEFLLNELGSGIGQFILLLAKALFINPSFILIDEPENSLHPKMQEAFIRVLASKAKNGLLATSHSVGLARSVADKIYVLTKHDGIPLLNHFGQHYSPTIAQSINEMGYSQYVEIGGNNILLVEGRTDIKVFREILRKYGIDNKFIIIALGGGEFILKDKQKIIEELNEINRLNPKSISVIFDSERSSSTSVLGDKYQAFKEVCESLGFKVFATDKHSTENYLSQEAINKVLGSHYIALDSYQNFNSITNKWPKEKNWLVVIEMSKKDFEGTELDSFIQNELVPISV
jgi:ABC-type cobalamin/Fe3+-siderophores transport system ATPase subunit